MSIQGTARNPKRLSDYSLRQRSPGSLAIGYKRNSSGMPTPSEPNVRYGPTAAERTKASRDKYKAFVMKDIADSDKRRNALVTMWQAESAKVTQDRKDAVSEYKTVMATQPDPTTDEDGTLRAAWENQPHVQAAKDRMKAHIQGSLDESNRKQATQEDPAGQMGLKVQRPPGDKRHPGDAGTRGPEQPVTKKYQGFDAKPKPKFQVKQGEVKTVGNKKIELNGDVAYKNGKVFYMGYTLDAQGKRIRVGIPEAELNKAKSTKKSPEVEPTGPVQPRPKTAKWAFDVEGI